jgi:hypothetical protein
MSQQLFILENAIGAASREYLAHKWDVHAVPQSGDGKAPAPWWLKRAAEPRDFDETTNVGLKTGSPIGRAFVADVDIDLKDPQTKQMFPGANVVVEELTPICRHVFGRRGAPRTHRLYATTEPVSTVRYQSVHGHGVSIELRGLAPKSRKPQQTVIPPGLHKTGERISWETCDGYELAVVDAAGLREMVKHAAVALAILEIYPPVGQRHDARLAFSKILLEAKLEPRICKTILRAVVKATGGNLADVDPCVDSTQALDPQKAVGAAWIQEHLGEAGLKTVAAIHKILDVAKMRPKGIDTTDMDLKTFTPQVWTRIEQTNEPPRLFLQGGLPVRVEHIPERRQEKKQTFVFKPAVADVIRHEVAKVQDFFYLVGKNYRQIAPPTEIIRNMLATPPNEIPLPPVTRIVYAPTVAPDGTIQLTPGYQPATGVVYVAHGLDVPPVPQDPTADDVRAALAKLKEPIAEFPFINDTDRAHALAFMLLPFVRDAIDGPTPLHLFEKSTAGEGSGLLTDVLLYPAVGDDIARLAPCDDDDEWRKQITSTLLEGPSIVMIDNTRSLVSPQLALAITSSIWQARILGFSRNATLKVECVWGATGINPTLHQEIVRRIVRCRLESGEERPWLRTGWKIPDLRTWSREHRSEMVHAALTLIRYWFVQGKQPGTRVLGMFESWARVIGGILETAGVPGFLSGLEDFYDEVDVEGDAIRWFVHTWVEKHGSKPVTLSDVALWALAPDSPIVSLLPARSEHGTRTAFGAFVRRLRRRVVNVKGAKVGVQLVADNAKESRRTFRVCANGAEPVVSEQSEMVF